MELVGPTWSSVRKKEPFPLSLILPSGLAGWPPFPPSALLANWAALPRLGRSAGVNQLANGQQSVAGIIVLTSATWVSTSRLTISCLEQAAARLQSRIASL